MNGYAGNINQNSIGRIKPERQVQTSQNVMTVPTKSVGATTITRTSTAVDKIPDINAIDLQSQYGRFGWPEASSDVYFGIPYILRNSTKYFAVQMILTKPSIRAYLSSLHQDVYNYYFRVIEHATDAERYLLNEINMRHCDGMFGRSLFTTESLTLIRDTDAYELWMFLDICHRQLTFCPVVISNKIGFIEFSFDSNIYVPFVVRDNEQYMPLYCFSNVNHVPVDYLSGWDLAYLRFCCMYQGIWRGSTNIYPVVSLSSMRAYLPVDTQFFTCWPLSSEHNLMRNSVPVGNGWKRKTEKIAIGKHQTLDATMGSGMLQSGTRKRCGETIDGKPLPKLRRIQQPNEFNRKIQKIIANNFRKLQNK